ncbi:MAG TPA: uracil-DNA glycosylase [Polyangiales bacterium]|jgi:DNA polymerase|nr:uracil-DNA glycosylase [Polyangiales bacterium]
MQLEADLTEELLAVTASLRAHLEAEDDLGAPGLALRASAIEIAPRLSVPDRTPQRSPAAPAPHVELPRPAALSGSDKRLHLQQLATESAGCTRCVLHEKRNRSVFERGSPDAEIAFVGEGPGRDEDAQGLPFVGAAGQLLDKMIAAMGYGRDAVYICNVVKCRPPENRTPRPEEAIACSHFLVPQLETVAPKVIVALGRCAAQALGVAEASGSWRGRWGAWRGVPILPTYHPAFLLRSPEFKRTVWEDLQLVMARLGRSPAPRG